MILEFSIAGRMEMPDHTCRFLSAYVQMPGSPETGAVLGGYYRSNRLWVISHPMPPSPRNKAGRTWLRRHRGDAQAFIEQVFRQTGGIVNYVGEWHTHPEPNPSPSPDDKRMLRDLLRTSRLEIPFLVGVIVGTSGALCVWCQDHSGKTEQAVISPGQKDNPNRTIL